MVHNLKVRLDITSVTAKHGTAETGEQYRGKLEKLKQEAKPPTKPAETPANAQPMPKTSYTKPPETQPEKPNTQPVETPKLPRRLVFKGGKIV